MTEKEIDDLTVAVRIAFQKAGVRQPTGKLALGNNEWGIAIRPRQPLSAAELQIIKDEAKPILKREIRDNEIDARVSIARMG